MSAPKSALRPVSSRSAGLHPAVPYVAPFAAFMLLLAAGGMLEPLGRWEPAFRAVVLTAVLWLFSRSVLDFRIAQPLGSVALGVAVFALWIGPDLLVPGYRDHWLFQNGITGSLRSSLPTGLQGDPFVLGLRSFRAIILVPVIEELFWRAWLMRYVVNSEFQRVPLGTYTAASLWITALLFASEHGPYWEVGLAAGLLYNWWMIRTKRLGDCILAHAVTNACLCAYVLATSKWEYWL